MKTLLAILVAITLSTVSLYSQTPDRSKPPELGTPAPLKLPPIQHFKLSNGLPVVMMEKHSVPLVQINLLVNTGSAMDGEKKSGLASLTAAMLDEGAGSRNALELADAIDYLGASIAASAGQHTSVIALHTPISKLDSALSLMGDMAIRPTFPEQELERLRKERLTTLAQWHDQPAMIAAVTFNQTLYGTHHPYGLPAMGSEQSLRSFRIDDLKRFHKSYYHPNNATLIVVGDVTQPEIQRKLEAVFGSWTGGTEATVNWPDMEQIEKRVVFLVDKPGAAQSEIRIGRIGVARTTEDYYPIVVMNTILGGSFTSRLNQNLRETHGYSYGAGSRFEMRPLPGPFIAYSAVQTNVTDKALAEFMKELRGILQPVTNEDLKRAKNYVALGYPDNFESVESTASMLAEMVTYNLPDSYFNDYVGRVLAVTTADVERVAKSYIDPEKMAVIVVGDRKEVEKGIKALKLGAIQNMTIDDVLGKIPKVE